VVEFIPYILIVIGWHPDHPGKFELYRRLVVHSQAECDLIGDDTVESHKQYEDLGGGVKYTYFCIPAPSSEEQDAAWKALQDEIEREQDEPRGETE
jgi:hypothetical protein